MKEFEFSLTKKEVFDHLYEYIISRSCEFFEVPNIDVTYSIIINVDSLIMFVFTDDNTCFVNTLNAEDLAFTDDNCGKIQVKSEQDLIKIYHGKVCLNSREIRYVKFSWNRILNEVGQMFYTMVNTCLKLNSHIGEMFYDCENKKFFYRGFIRKKFRNKNNIKIDLTNQMKKTWY